MNSTAPPSTTPRAHVQSFFLNTQGLHAGWSALLFVCIFLLALLVLSTISGLIARHLHLPLHVTQGALHPYVALLSESILLASTLLATIFMARLENRSPLSYGLTGPNRAQHFLTGLLAGFGFLSLLMLLLLLTHHVQLDASTLAASALWRSALLWGCAFLLVGCTEELLLRGYLLQTLARGIGFWPAALALALLFGSLHKTNPGESRIGLLTAALIALLFSLSLRRIGSLWWAIGFHSAWDWAESFFYGTPDSGILSQGRRLTAHAHGPLWWSGGVTGPEGSALCLPILAALWLWILLTQRTRPISA
jgi:membrane protease YdiL (CAAX protease family)